MTRIPCALSLVAALAVATTGAHAQPQADSPVARSEVPGGVTIVPAEFIAQGLRGSDLLNADVYNGRSQQLGTVRELIAAERNGALRMVIMETGGFLGIDSRRLAIPVDRFAALAPQLVLRDATPESLEQLPDANDRHIATLADVRLTHLMEARVYNDANEELGEVVDLVISREGVITVVIIDVGGFLGLDSHRLAIPRQQFAGLGERLLLPQATREILRGLPPHQDSSP